jgi:hypothetical protein
MKRMSPPAYYKICGSMKRPFVIMAQVPNMHSNATIACGNKQSDIPPDKGQPANSRYSDQPSQHWGEKGDSSCFINWGKNI